MDMTFILYSIGVFLVIVLVLVIILLVAKKYLSPSGNVTITINGKDKLEVEQGSSLLMMFTSLLPVVVRVLADSANVRWYQVVAKSSTQRKDTSLVSRLRKATVLVASAR